MGPARGADAASAPAPGRLAGRRRLPVALSKRTADKAVLLPPGPGDARVKGYVVPVIATEGVGVARRVAMFLTRYKHLAYVSVATHTGVGAFTEGFRAQQGS